MSERLTTPQNILEAVYTPGPIVQNEVGEAQLLEGTNGDILPFYLSFKDLHNYPLLRTELLQGLRNLIDVHSPRVQVIGGVQSGGASFAAPLAEQLQIPFAWVRGKKRDHGIPKAIDGASVYGKETVLVDDVATTSGSIIRDLIKYREAGAIVNTVIVGAIRNEAACTKLKNEYNVELYGHFNPTEIEEFTRGKMFQQDTQLLQIPLQELQFHQLSGE